MPDSDFDPGEQIAEPTDAWIESLIRRVRKIPVSEPVSLDLVRRVRAQFRSLARRRIRARRERAEAVVATIDDIGDDARQDVREVLLDLVRSPHGQTAIWLLLGTPVFLAAAVDIFPVRQSTRHRAAEIHRYLVAKVGGESWSSYPGSRRPYIVSAGRRVPARSSREVGAHPLHTAAVNAVTPRAARAWLYRLDAGSDADRSSVLHEMEEIGLAACEASAFMALWTPESGEPRGLWPDPPPPEADGLAVPASLPGTVPVVAKKAAGS